MKTKLLAVFFVVLSAQSLLANPVIVSGKLSNDICGKVWSGRVTDLEIGIFNPDSLLTEFDIVIAITSTDGVQITPEGLTFLNTNDSLFLFVSPNFFIEDGVAKYAIHAVTAGPWTGLPPSNDTIPFFSLSFRTGSPFLNGLTICFDSTSSTTEGEWSVTPGSSLTWGGTVCFETFEPSPTAPFFVFCPPTIAEDSYCDSYSHQFRAGSDIGDPVGYILHSGPGELNPRTGQWTFVPTSADAGQTFSLVVNAGEDWCGDSTLERLSDQCQVTVTVGSLPPPQFQAGQNSIFVATSGDTLPITFAIDNPGSCTPHQYAYYIEPGDPQPTGYIDVLSGTFFYTGTVADTGTYKINLVLSAGSIADTNSFFIYHYDDKACGDMDHSGSVDIADLTWLINFLFINFFPPPLPESSGNVDCNGGVDISDLTVLIDHLFINFPPLCSGC